MSRLTKNVNVIFRITPEVHAWLKDDAAKNGRHGINEHVRAIVNDYVQKGMRRK